MRVGIRGGAGGEGRDRAGEPEDKREPAAGGSELNGVLELLGFSALICIIVYLSYRIQTITFINDMKKYSSYADLKISKPIGIDTKTPNSPSFRKAFALDLPVLLLSKDPFPIPASTKYSAGYIQRNKIFTKKDKDPSKENQATIINENQAAK